MSKALLVPLLATFAALITPSAGGPADSCVAAPPNTHEAEIEAIGSAPQRSMIKLATLVPEGSVWDKAFKQMGSDWKKNTQGRVNLRVYPGGIAAMNPTSFARCASASCKRHR